MSAVFSKGGFKRLGGAWLVLALSVAAAVASAWGSHLYLEKEERDGLSSKRQLAEALARVEAAKRERADLQASAEIFQDLVDRGILGEESRLDFVERLERLKSRHRIQAMEFEIAPQRPLQLSGGRVFGAIDVLASRVRVKVQALHEGEALAFLEELARPSKGFNPASRCTFRRVEPAAPPGPGVEAECTLEWISLKAKGGARAG